MFNGSMITPCVCASLPFKQHEEDILLGAEVLHCGRPSANLTPKDIVEDLSHIFLSLEVTDKAYITLPTKERSMALFWQKV